jgi:hypothetical protein
MMTIELLPAAHGDAIWVEYGAEESPWRVLIDGGPAHTYANGLRAWVKRLPDEERRIELMVVTHIDADHIDGAILLLQERAELKVSIRELWFNGWHQLPKLERDTYAPLQGEFLDALIASDGTVAEGRNRAFGRGPVVVPDTGDLPAVELRGGARLTLLGPTTAELRRLRARWSAAIRDFAPGDAEEARRRLAERREYRPPATPAVFSAKSAGDDRSVANGSSISFLFEYEGSAVLFAGDAHARTLAASLRRLVAARGVPRLRFDAVKLPHHGSLGNVHADWLDLVDCERWLVSTNGAVFDHPDEEAVALVGEKRDGPVRILCNYDSPSTRRLLASKRSWSVEHPGSEQVARGGGMLIRLDGRRPAQAPASAGPGVRGFEALGLQAEGIRAGQPGLAAQVANGDGRALAAASKKPRKKPTRPSTAKGPASGNAGKPAGKLHALLIGIDAYDGAVSLDGCVNDIDAVQAVLIERLGIEPKAITRLAAPLFETEHDTRVGEVLPTLANIKKAFKRLADTVKPGERVFIYYSGHGTQVLLEDEGGARFVREALIPTDRIKDLNEQYFFDWELNQALSRIAGKTSSISVILDCCCSSGATREAFDRGQGKARFDKTSSVFKLVAEQAPPPSGSHRGLSSGIPGAVASCLVVAACLDDEKARESVEQDGRTHGELTRALIAQLAKLPKTEPLGELRWGRIWRAVVAAVSERNGAQHPTLTGGFARRVFGGPPEDGDAGYGIARAGAKFQLDVGSLSGVTEGAQVAVYGPEPPLFPPLGSAQDHAARVGVLRVESAERSTAVAVAETKLALPAAPRGRLVAAGRPGRIRVGLFPHDAELAKAIEGSTLLQLAPTNTRGDVDLERRKDGAWALTDDVFDVGDEPGQPVLCVLPEKPEKFARAVLEHYHTYSAPLRFAKACQDLPTALALRVHDCKGLSPEQAQSPASIPSARPGSDAPYLLEHGARICFSVENSAKESLSVFLVVCQQSGSVAVLSKARIPGRNEETGRPGFHAFWANDTLGEAFKITLPHGKTIGVDRLVAIGTTKLGASLDHLVTTTRFASLFDRLRGDRDIGAARAVPVAELWTNAVTAIRCER